MDFGDQMALAARLARDLPRGRRGRAGPVPGGAARRVPGHLPRPAACCCARCSAPGTRCRSPRSATRTSRSTAGAGPARAPSSGSRRLRRRRAGPVAAAVDELAQRPGDPRRRQPGGRPLRARPAGCRSRSRPRAPGPAAATSPRRACATVEDEAALRRGLGGSTGRSRPGRRTAAVLCRKRSQFDPWSSALRARGCRSRSSGSAGCSTPPRCATSSPCCGSCTTRPRRPADAAAHRAAWRLGAADLDALGGLGRGARQRTRVAEPRRRPSHADARSDRSSIGRDASTSHPAPRRLDDPGAERTVRSGRSALRAAGRLLRRRRCAGCAPSPTWRCPTWSPRPSAPSASTSRCCARPGLDARGAARAHLDAFGDVAAGFAASADGATLGGFLAWLEAADERGARPRPG